MIQARKKNRLEKFLYSNWYFIVTINSHNHIKYFWEVISDEMVLNKYWKIVEECWLDLMNHYKNISLDEYVIMPNHFHGIVIIDNIFDTVGNGFKPFLTKKQHWLSEIIRWFKTFSSLKLHQSWLTNFSRQKSFYDHIIRNEQDLQRIQEYIKNNPYKRQNDEYYK